MVHPCHCQLENAGTRESEEGFKEEPSAGLEEGSGEKPEEVDIYRKGSTALAGPSTDITCSTKQR